MSVHQVRDFLCWVVVLSCCLSWRIAVAALAALAFTCLVERCK